MEQRLCSIHLEGTSRREAFRRARARVECAIGSDTLAGQLVTPKSQGSDRTPIFTGRGNSVPSAVCWILDQGSPLALKVGLNSLGRLPDNDIVINDPTISRRHCVIVVHSDMRCELYDVASKNGTTLNGKKLSGPTRLVDGDIICLCDRKLVFVQNSGSPTVTRPHNGASPSDECTQVG